MYITLKISFPDCAPTSVIVDMGSAGSDPKLGGGGTNVTKEFRVYPMHKRGQNSLFYFVTL
jgi:hypothetical protein